MEKTLEKLCEEAISICVHTRCSRCEYGGRTLLPREGQRCQGKLLADYLRKHGVVAQRWIPVEERLPALIPCNAGAAYSDAVNVLTSGRKVLTAIWDGTDFIADAGFWEAEDEKVTHWTPVLLPLPELPKEDA